ncbi:hypothetical protein [Flavobacterium laiguense]|uniref:Uncharacterized protein n=1 Tax=Flavobacterium laiguense TaxID=2169409 RepID=A0A2U1JK02_9FLAO|nr:hypothetical protein [Flavobacterium laiguense]PWA05467.1 hypothetical protein DB891_16995 [Flavobacterium laiguense]
MKYLFGIVLLICVSCGNKEDVLLPKADATIVKEVVDLSPIYIFFRVKGKDTLAEVNRKNSIITTNWILNIDRRLPLRLVIPEVMKLQQKKREEKEHRNELALNYYSYADSIGKNLAFIPFTEVYYKLEKPKKGLVVFFSKKGKITVNNEEVSKQDLQKIINKSNTDSKKVIYCFDKNSSYGSYIQSKVFLYSVTIKNEVYEEFVY